MASGHSVGYERCEGFAGRVLASDGGLRAVFVPGAGMVCASLRDQGVELLGQRAGLAAYVATGATFGIPLLHPWANRLPRRGLRFGGVSVRWPEETPGIPVDGHGLPLHGLMAGAADWQVIEHRADAEAARLAARLDFCAEPARATIFPFPHVLTVDARLSGRRLHIATALQATGRAEVPVAFGWHPYLTLPDVERADWHLALPVRRRCRLDDRCLPTGEVEAVRLPPGPLGARCYDDLFDRLAPGEPFVLAGGGRRLEVRFGPGYDVAVVYAPPDDDVVCFEPMTAPTDPFEGGAPLRRVAPGESFEAGFSLTVQRTGRG